MQNVTWESVATRVMSAGEVHTTSELHARVVSEIGTVSRRQILRFLDSFFETNSERHIAAVTDSDGDALISTVAPDLEVFLSRQRNQRTLIVDTVDVPHGSFLVGRDGRGERFWSVLPGNSSISEALNRLKEAVGSDISVVPNGRAQEDLRGVAAPLGVTIADYAHKPLPYLPPPNKATARNSDQHPHLDALGSESIRIIREAVAVAKKPGMLFSMGKDSMVMLTLARKAFFPEPIPFPLVLIDSRWEFQEMYRFREYLETKSDFELIVHVNPDGVRDDINPFIHGSAHHTEVTRTQGLKQVLDAFQFDYVFGGARRDEEKSRAKERIFSVRNSKHGWDPKSQRPELWNLYNTTITPGQSMRVFPISNWTELDVWRYIEREAIELIPLYFSKVRPFVERNGALIMVDDERFIREPGEKIHFEPIRFRTLGCYPLTGGVRSEATTVAEIISELENSRVSERSSRVIDFDPGASMEQKKKEGYF